MPEQPIRQVPRPSARIGPAGRKLWRDVHAALDDETELDERDLAILALACRQTDVEAALQRQLDKSLVVKGSKGQPRLSAVVAELRQCRLSIARLLGDLELSQTDAAPTAASRRAQHAARVRHGHLREVPGGQA